MASRAERGLFTRRCILNIVEERNVAWEERCLRKYGNTMTSCDDDCIGFPHFVISSAGILVEKRDTNF
eukprot:scaffold1889_cov198-Amphora_coffeaeformis.AAC.2